MKGDSEPGLTNLIAIAKVANTTVEWLVTGQGPRGYEEYKTHGQLDRGLVEIILEAMEALTPEQLGIGTDGQHQRKAQVLHALYEAYRDVPREHWPGKEQVRRLILALR